MTTLTILTTAPADPATVTEYGDALPDLVRALVHVTRHHEALEEPADADRLIRNLSSAASGFTQLLEQVSGWLDAEQAAARIKIADGSPWYGGVTALVKAVAVARLRLERTQALARMLQQALDAVAEVTSDMAAVRDDSSEEGQADG